MDTASPHVDSPTPPPTQQHGQLVCLLSDHLVGIPNGLSPPRSIHPRPVMFPLQHKTEGALVFF